MSNRFFITVLVVIAMFVGVFAFTKHKNNSQNTNNIQPTNHITGTGKSGVVLTEYGDYQCPACGQYYPLVKQVVEMNKDQITFQFRNFPLVQIHPHAFVASRAAEAAALQNKFWEMHDTLYENQATWSASSNPLSYFLNYAGQLGLDVNKFQQDMNAQATNDKIRADIEQGQKLGATATPTFAINGKKVEKNPRSVEEFNQLIADAIKAKASSQ